MNPSVQWEQDLAAKDHEYYEQLYQYEGEGKSKQDIELFLLKAKQIPRQQLNQIIGAAYQSNGSNLDNKKSFYMALKLIACAQSNQSPSTPILSTDTPLPSFDDYDFITKKDRQKYIRIFHAAGPSNGYLSGQDAMKILMRSKLPVGLLSQIWNLSDIREEGKLDVHGFIIAMHYVAKCMNGNTTLPESKVPRSILLSAFADNPQLSPSFNTNKLTTETNENNNSIATTSMESPVKYNNSSDENQLFSPINPSSPWIINNNEYATYVNAFKNIDTQNYGYIEGGQVVGFFNHSDLPPSDLANIWDLADTQNSGKLNVGEFAIAMHLIRRLRGGSTFSSFPSTLHDTLLSQIHAKPEPLNSPIESHESLKAQTIELQNNINKEQAVINGLNNDIQKQDDVLNTLRETVKTLEDTLQQTISQKIELQNLLGSMKKSEMEKRHKIAILEKEYNNNQSEIKSLKAVHQQQLVFSSVSDRQLEAAQQQRDRSVEDLALAQDGQFDKLSDPSPPLIKQNIPKPPPPSSRHHRTPSVRNSSNATSARKPPAPPPSKKNRASVVMTSPSSVISTNNNILTTDKSIKEESGNKKENEAFSSSAIAASTISAIASSNVNMDSVISSAAVTQKEQPSTGSLSTNQEIVSTSQSETVQTSPANTNVIDSTQKQPTQSVDTDSEEEEDDDDDEDEDDEDDGDDEDDTSSDTSSEAESPSQSSEIAVPAAAAAAVTLEQTSTSSTPIISQNKIESTNVAKTKENDDDDNDNKSLKATPYETTTQDSDKNMDDMTNAKKDESRGINNETKKDDQIQQDIAKATTEDITNTNDSSIENHAKDNSITDDHVDSIMGGQNKDSVIMSGNVTKKEPALNKSINQAESSPVTNDGDDANTKIQPSITHLEQGKQQDDDNNKKMKVTQKTEGEVTVDNKNDKQQPLDNSNKTSSTEDESPGSTTSTKGDDHDDFEVLENTSTSSSFMSASMGIDDDAIDEFDAAFAETLPDAKVITSNNNNINNSNDTPIPTTATPITTMNDQQPSEKINESHNEDNFYDEDDFDKAFGNKELKSVPITTTTAATTAGYENNNKDRNNNNDQTTYSTTTTTQNEPTQKNDPFWVDESSPVKNEFEDSFMSTSSPLSSNNDHHKTDLTFGDAFTTTPSGFNDAFTTTPSDFNDAFTSSSGFGDSFTATATTPTQQQHNFEKNDAITKNVQNTNEANNNEFSSTNEFSEMLDQHKAFNSQSPFNNPFEEFTENNNSNNNNTNEMIIQQQQQQQQQQQRDPSIKEDTTGYATDHNNKHISNETIEDHTKPTEPTIVSPIITTPTTPSVVPNNTQSTGSSISVPQQQQQQHSTNRPEEDHSTPTAKGKKGKFSLSSMLPKQKGKKSKSKSSKKEKEAVTTNKNHHDPSTATLSSLHSNNSRNTNEFLETSLPQLTEQEVMANLRDFGNDTESVTTIVNMGFTVDQAKEALKRYDYDVEKALNFLLDQ